MVDAPPDVVALVVRLRRNLALYKRDDYKETRVRVEFVDPFFEALGYELYDLTEEEVRIVEGGE